MKHYQKPEIDNNEFDEDAKKKMAKILQSDYYAYVNKLKKKIGRQIVKDSCAGISGFILFLENGDWIAPFLQDNQLLYENGSGKPEKRIYSVINSEKCGDGSELLDLNLQKNFRKYTKFNLTIKDKIL